MITCVLSAELRSQCPGEVSLVLWLKELSSTIAKCYLTTANDLLHLVNSNIIDKIKQKCQEKKFTFLTIANFEATICIMCSTVNCKELVVLFL